MLFVEIIEITKHFPLCLFPLAGRFLSTAFLWLRFIWKAVGEKQIKTLPYNLSLAKTIVTIHTMKHKNVHNSLHQHSSRCLTNAIYSHKFRYTRKHVTDIEKFPAFTLCPRRSCWPPVSNRTVHLFSIVCPVWSFL